MRVVLVPVKKFSDANERLCGVLSPRQRARLARVMLEDVLSSVSVCTEADGAVLVTAEEEAMRMGRGFGMEIISEKTQRSESSSVEFAMGKCAEMGAESTLVVPGDIPLAQGREFDAVMKKDDGENRVVIVPSRDGMGTNALMMRPPGVISPSFGENSFSRHKKMVSAAGVEFSSLTFEGIGLDIDGPEDLEIFMEKGGNTRTHEYLRGLAIPAKTEKPA